MKWVDGGVKGVGESFAGQVLQRSLENLWLILLNIIRDNAQNTILEKDDQEEKIGEVITKCIQKFIKIFYSHFMKLF